MNEQSASENGKGFIGSLQCCVEEYPISATVTSLATGFCVGLLLTRLIESAVAPPATQSYTEWMGGAVRDSLGRLVPRQLQT
jgi:hypothetical protein